MESTQTSGREHERVAVCPRCGNGLGETDGGYLEQGEYCCGRYDAERSLCGYYCGACGLVLYTAEPLAVALGYRPDPEVERGRQERLALITGAGR